MQHQRKERKKFYKYTTKFSSIQWVFVSLKKFFRTSRCAVGLCNIIVNCQVKIAEVLLSSPVQCTYSLQILLLTSLFLFLQFKVQVQRNSQYQGSRLLATLQLWYIHFRSGWSGVEIKCTVHVALPQTTHKLVLTGSAKQTTVAQSLLS